MHPHILIIKLLLKMSLHIVHICTKLSLCMCICHQHVYNCVYRGGFVLPSLMKVAKAWFTETSGIWWVVLASVNTHTCIYMCILPKAKDNHTSYMYCMHVAMATCVAGHVLTVVHHLATCTICALYTVLCCTNTYIIINIIVLFPLYISYP